MHLDSRARLCRGESFADVTELSVNFRTPLDRVPGSSNHLIDLHLQARAWASESVRGRASTSVVYSVHRERVGKREGGKVAGQG